MIDVLIVGAGPAGSSAALRLARDGYAVALLEKAKFPRPKVCGEYLSPGACAALSKLALLEAVAQEAHRLQRIILAGFEAEPVVLRLPDGGALSLERSRFDDLLLRAACNAGSALIGGTFLSATQDEDGVDVRYRDGEGASRSLRCRVLVGADGAQSMVATRTSMARRRLLAGRWAVGGHLRAQSSGDALEMFVGPGGYYARNPLGGGRANTMLVMPKPCLGAEAERAVAAITRGARSFDEASLERRVAIGPLRWCADTVARGRVLLTGDAAGFLDPFVGQGIAVALESSLDLREAVASLLRDGASHRAAQRYAAARAALARPRKILTAILETVIRTPLLRSRASVAVRRSAKAAETILAAVSGAANPLGLPSLRALAALFV